MGRRRLATPYPCEQTNTTYVGTQRRGAMVMGDTLGGGIDFLLLSLSLVNNYLHYKLVSYWVVSFVPTSSYIRQPFLVVALLHLVVLNMLLLH